MLKDVGSSRSSFTTHVRWEMRTCNESRTVLFCSTSTDSANWMTLSTQPERRAITSSTFRYSTERSSQLKLVLQKITEQTESIKKRVSKITSQKTLRCHCTATTVITRLLLGDRLPCAHKQQQPSDGEPTQHHATRKNAKATDNKKRNTHNRTRPSPWRWIPK